MMYTAQTLHEIIFVLVWEKKKSVFLFPLQTVRVRGVSARAHLPHRLPTRHCRVRGGVCRV